MARTGFNFRATSGYVTDASGDIYVLITDAYPTTRSGVTFGWKETTGGGASDINNTYDPKIAGYHYVNDTTGAIRFQIDGLTGSKQIRVAAGDPSNAYDQRVSVRDSTTQQFIVSATNTSGKYLDATSTEYTPAAWPGSNTQSSAYTFSTNVTIYIGGSGASYTTLAHIEVADASAGTSIPTLTGDRYVGGFYKMSGGL